MIIYQNQLFKQPAFRALSLAAKLDDFLVHHPKGKLKLAGFFADVEWGLTHVVEAVDVSAVFNQNFSANYISILCCSVQGGGAVVIGLVVWRHSRA